MVLPCSSRSEFSNLIKAASASGAGPPNMPECTGPARVSTVTTTLTLPRSVSVNVGTPTAKFPLSHTRIASARNSSGFASTNRSSPPVPCSSEPSATSVTPTGNSVPSARSAVRCMTILPLQSAAPRPYQRPSFSVSSHTGVRQAASSSGGCTS